MISPVPRSYRDGHPFDDMRALLGWLLRRLAAPARTNMSFPGLSEEMRAILGAVIPLLRVQHSYGTAVYRLSGLKLSESAYGTCRSMLEVRASMSYILETAPAVERALESMVWSLLVAQSPPGKPSKGITNALNMVRAADARLYSAVTQRFPKKRFAHSSGMRWTELVSKYGGSNAKFNYGFLSWHTHAIVATAADLQSQTSAGSTTTTYRQVRAEALAANDVCTYATGFLSDTWREFHGVFGHLGRPTRRP